jgi:hypothetical protein
VQLHPKRLRIEHPRPTDVGVHPIRILEVGDEGVVRELEVPGGDRDTVAPARFRPDVVRQREGVPPSSDRRDEVRTRHEVGAELEGPLQNLWQRRIDRFGTERVEARRLGDRRPADDHGAAALGRLHVRAARTRDDEERGSDRRR